VRRNSDQRSEISDQRSEVINQKSEIGNQAPPKRFAQASRQSEIENQKSEINALGALAPNAFTILVMGGSRGAHRLNAVVSQAILRLYREGNPLQVIHLAGPADEESIRQVYQQAGMPAAAGVPHAVFGFLHDMPRAYQMASLAICRSGASTCAELACYGVPALLVPYPFAIHQHQAANADALASAGAADICDEQILTVDWLVGYVADLMRDPARLAHMRTAALQRVTNNPASTLAELVEEVGSQPALRSPDLPESRDEAGTTDPATLKELRRARARRRTPDDGRQTTDDRRRMTEDG